MASNDLQWIYDNFPKLTDLSPLASGGQKFVFSAQHRDIGPIVLKFLLISGDTEARFEREILSVKEINSNRVPQIYDHGQLQNNPMGAKLLWLFEQRILGDNLRTILSNRSLRVDEAITLGVQMLEAIAKAEEKKIVHRDIKPENIMRDNSGSFWLLDFGLARMLELDSITATGDHFGRGTVGYSAPEQMSNRKRLIDNRADLFALGVVLYEAITGGNPFILNARDVLERLRNVQNVALPALSLAEDPNSSLWDFVSSCTQKFPNQRVHTAKEALEWLQEIKKNISNQSCV